MRWSSAKRLIYSALHQPPSSKALVFTSIVVLGSLLCSLSLVPASRFFSDKNNSLNVYLAKYCWGWTLLLLFPLVFISSFMYTACNWLQMARHLGRLLVCHLSWYLVTGLFDAINRSTGSCTSDNISEHSTCVKKGYTWISFDISGHVFLLIYCVLVISEECALVRKEVWERYKRILEDKSSMFSVEKYEQLHSLQKLVEPVFVLLEICCFALIVLWTVLVVASSLYFHHFLEKTIGCLCAYIFWRCTYALTELNWPSLPCPPRHGVLNPLN